MKTSKNTSVPNISIELTEYNPPKHELESLARCLYSTMVAYFESEEGKREFAEWKKRQVDVQ